MKTRKSIIISALSLTIIICFIAFAEENTAKAHKKRADYYVESMPKILRGDHEVLERKSVTEKAFMMFKCIPTRRIADEKEQIFPIKNGR